MTEETYTYPSMRLRMFGFAFISSMQYTLVGTVLGSLAWHSKQPASFQSTFSIICILAGISAFSFFLFKIAKQGMTFRHFVFGYQVVKQEDGSYPGIVKLYSREVIAYAAGCVWVMKMFLPILFKAAVQGIDGKNDHHVVTSKSDGLYVSNKSVGQMRTDQAIAQSRVDAANEMHRLSQEGFFHDNLFGTCAVNASRSEVLKTFKSQETPPAVPTETKKAA